jgi:hypothetical protein
MTDNVRDKMLATSVREANRCCLCTNPIEPDDARLVLYQPKQPMFCMVWRAHEKCFFKDPVKAVALMPRSSGFVEEPLEPIKGTAVRLLHASPNVSVTEEA